MKATFLGVMLIFQHVDTRPKQKIHTYRHTYMDQKKRKNKQWKAIYKISKINTIFIIDMLQNKFP